MNEAYVHNVIRARLDAPGTPCGWRSEQLADILAPMVFQMAEAMHRTRVSGIAKAIADPGPKPEHHLKVLERHRKEWPTLWREIDEVMAYAGKDVGC